MSARLTLPDAQTLGRRVTIRYRIGSLATDVIGHVESVGPVITVRRRDGRVTEVDPGRIVAWKVVPERRPGLDRQAKDDEQAPERGKDV